MVQREIVYKEELMQDVNEEHDKKRMEESGGHSVTEGMRERKSCGNP